MIFLSRYSPMMNQIEDVFKDIKKEIKHFFRTTYHDESINVVHLPFGELENKSIEILVKFCFFFLKK